MKNNVEFAKVHNMPNYALISLKALIKKDKINRFVYMKELCNLGSLFSPNNKSLNKTSTPKVISTK